MSGHPDNHPIYVKFPACLAPVLLTLIEVELARLGKLRESNNRLAGKVSALRSLYGEVSDGIRWASRRDSAAES